MEHNPPLAGQQRTPRAWLQAAGSDDRLDLTEPITTLGRSEGNTIRLDDRRASRYHAQIEWRDEEVWISDLGSSNGTFVNDEQISELRLLADGDTIGIGESRFTFHRLRAAPVTVDVPVVDIVQPEPPVGEPPRPSAFLQALEGDKRFPLDDEVITIGRSEGNTIRLQDKRISRQHAQIEWRGNELWIADLGSSNGTFVNGEQVSEPRQLAHGDEIRYGEICFTLHVLHPAPVTPDTPVSEPVPPEVSAPSTELTRALAENNIFRLRVSAEGGEMQLKVEYSPVGRPSSPLMRPYSEVAQVELLKELEEHAGAEIHEMAGMHQDIGARLFKTLVPGGTTPETDVRRAFDAAASRAKTRQKPLTLQLRFDLEAVEQAQLPWELLHDGLQHLVLAEDLHLNRYITYFGDREAFTPVEELRVLYIIARPTDLDDLPHYAERDLMVEGLGKQVRAGKVHIDLLEASTFENLRTALQGKAYHVLHFDGHGAFHESYQEGVLCFEDAEEKTDIVPASRLADLLQGSSVRLVVLSACQSGLVRGSTVLNSVGPALIRANVPAVVAMQFSIPMGATMAFTQEFYASLARGESVAAAVADGRKAIAQEYAAWFFPALYLRAADGEGYLFSAEPEAHATLRRFEMAELVQEWEQMPSQEQAEYDEGPLETDDLEEILEIAENLADLVEGIMDLADQIGEMFEQPESGLADVGLPEGATPDGGAAVQEVVRPIGGESQAEEEAPKEEPEQERSAAEEEEPTAEEAPEEEEEPAEDEAEREEPKPEEEPEEEAEPDEPPEEEGPEIPVQDPSEPYTPPFIAHLPGLPDVIHIPEIGDMVLVPGGEFIMGTAEIDRPRILADLETYVRGSADRVMARERQEHSKRYPEQPQPSEADRQQMAEQYIQGLRQRAEAFVQGEMPQHIISVPTFYISLETITFKQWWAFAQAGACGEPDYWPPVPEGYNPELADSYMYQHTPSNLPYQRKAWEANLEKLRSFIEELRKAQPNVMGLGQEIAGQPVTDRAGNLIEMQYHPNLERAVQVVKDILQESLQDAEDALRKQESILNPLKTEKPIGLLCPWWVGEYSWRALDHPFAHQMATQNVSEWIKQTIGTLLYAQDPAQYRASYRLYLWGGMQPHDPVPTLDLFSRVNPKIVLSYDEARAFCMWASARSYERHDKNALIFTLPTEAEWEKSSRGTDGRIYPWGDEAQPVDQGSSPYGLTDYEGDDYYETLGWINGVYLFNKNSEWTATQSKPYPYDENDGRNEEGDLNQAIVARRGGMPTAPPMPDAGRCAGPREGVPSGSAGAPMRFRVVTRSIEAVRRLQDQIGVDRDPPRSGPIANPRKAVRGDFLR